MISSGKNKGLLLLFGGFGAILRANTAPSTTDPGMSITVY